MYIRPETLSKLLAEIKHILIIDRCMDETYFYITLLQHCP
uniref:Uncharacterized protein n=1 Tax=Anguilla anguilla TaxID=7936 RepID=A0A0E9WGV1_ANGAN